MRIKEGDLEVVIEDLLEKFPNKIPKKVKDASEFYVAMGQQQVIAHLEAVLESKRK